jgi:hypothetical protein
MPFGRKKCIHRINLFISALGDKAVFVAASSVRNLGHRVRTKPKKGAE